MPYVKKEYRKKYDKTINKLASLIADDGHSEGYQTLAGNLNYTITTLIHKVYAENDDKTLGRKLSYSEYNEIIGLLECAKLEVYRRHVAPYEDIKIKENGDVFPE
jgi:hypothetical protein